MFAVPSTYCAWVWRNAERTRLSRMSKQMSSTFVHCYKLELLDEPSLAI